MNPTSTTTLVATHNGWYLYTYEEATSPLIQDTLLAQNAGMPRPRDIRPQIRKAVDSKEVRCVTDWRELDRANREATVLEVQREVKSGKGRKQTVTTYWLNERAALHIAMFLRTPDAMALKRQVVEVYLRWRAGTGTTTPGLDGAAIALAIREGMDAALAPRDARIAALEAIVMPGRQLPPVPVVLSPLISEDSIAYLKKQMIATGKNMSEAYRYVDAKGRRRNGFAAVLGRIKGAFDVTRLSNIKQEQYVTILHFVDSLNESALQAMHTPYWTPERLEKAGKVMTEEDWQREDTRKSAEAAPISTNGTTNGTHEGSAKVVGRVS